jgi:hypothetical protein
MRREGYAVKGQFLGAEKRKRRTARWDNGNGTGWSGHTRERLGRAMRIQSSKEEAHCASRSGVAAHFRDAGLTLGARYSIAKNYHGITARTLFK